MTNLLKDLLLTAVGKAVNSAENAQYSLAGLVGEAQQKEEDGKKIVDNFLDDMDTQRAGIEAKVEDITKELLSKLNLSTHAEYNKLLDRVCELEIQLGLERGEITDDKVMKG